MEPRTLAGAKATIWRLIEHCGKDSKPSQWTPETFSDIRKSFEKPKPRRKTKSSKTAGLVGTVVKARSLGTIAGDIRRTKAFLNWAANDDQKLIPKPQYGKRFTVSKKALRKIRQQKGSTWQPKTYGNSLKLRRYRSSPSYWSVSTAAWANLKVKDLPNLDEADVYWRSDRLKTGGVRKFWLWPETKKAISEYLAHRERLQKRDKGYANLPEWEPLLFRTAQNNKWVTDVDGKSKDSIGWYFGRLAKKLRIRGTFYDLRRTFETQSNVTLDQMAVNLIMGHVPADDDMPSRYLQNIRPERIRLVCSHVRSWLFK